MIKKATSGDGKHSMSNICIMGWNNATCGMKGAGMQAPSRVHNNSYRRV